MRDDWHLGSSQTSGGPAVPGPTEVPVVRCRVMGVLNVTPDSFSDGGRFAGTAAAVTAGAALWEAGADIVDVGGESTRPGASRTEEDEELRRVLPVIEELVAQGVAVSVDTMRASVARRAVLAGASIVNDVSGGRADPLMHRAVADLEATYVLCHWRTPSRSMSASAPYDDVLGEVVEELERQIGRARLDGVREDQLILDPGLGFAKDGGHNWALLEGLPRLVDLGHPVLVGASRKRFLGELLAGPGGAPRPVAERDAATAAVTAWSALSGAWGVRVHDVGTSADAVRVAARLQDREARPAGRAAR